METEDDEVVDTPDDELDVPNSCCVCGSQEYDGVVESLIGHSPTCYERMRRRQQLIREGKLDPSDDEDVGMVRSGACSRPTDRDLTYDEAHDLINGVSQSPSDQLDEERPERTSPAGRPPLATTGFRKKRKKRSFVTRVREEREMAKSPGQYDYAYEEEEEEEEE